MKSLVIVIAVVVAATGKDVRSRFAQFESEFGRTYSSQSEREERFRIFADNVKMIDAHNANPHISWKMGVNQYADRTEAELKSRLGRKHAPKSAKTTPNLKGDLSQLPDSMDWRDSGCITDVKDQMFCGSCWAFASAAELETFACLSNGTLMELSAEHITACTPNPLQCGGSGGCGGSIEQLAYSYVQLFGLTLEKDYPYTSGFGLTSDCVYNPDEYETKVGCRGTETLPANDLQAVLDFVGTKGPLSIGVDASSWSFYSSGVFDGCDYDGNIAINHAVQLVGYGTDEEEGDYWLVRNSWDSSWGENGYIRLKREPTAVCGIDSTPLDGSACVGDGVETQVVCGMCGLLSGASYPIGTFVI